MYILKNAVKNITRSKGRNILIGIVIVIIAASSCVALSIKNSAAEIVSSYQKSFKVTASLGIDREAMRAALDSSGTGTQGQPGDMEGMRELMDSIKTPTLDEIKTYTDSQYVDSYTYTLSLSMNSSDIEPLTNDTSSSGTASSASGDTNRPGGNNSGGQGDFRFSRGDFTLIGYSGLSAMSGFIDGTYQITDGAMFEDGTEDAVCVISDELATENGLAVGGVITLTNPNDDTEAYTFTIVGLYKDTSVDSSAMNWFSNSANQIITDYAAAASVTAASAAAQETAAAAASDDGTAVPAAVTGQLSTTFYLANADDAAALETEMKGKGLSEYYTLTTNESTLAETLKPITNLNTFAGIFILVVLLVGGIILLMINMINIRERKYEVGVLRAIGMKKGKLAMQFVAELLIVTFLSILIGTVAGAAVSVPTAQSLLQSEVDSIQNSQTQIAQNFGRPGGDGTGQTGGTFGGGFPGGGNREILGGVFNRGVKVDYISQINAVISIKVVLELILIGIVLTLFASIISVVLIARYEPLKILSNRSS